MAEKALRAGLASGASGNAGQEATSPGVPAAPALLFENPKGYSNEARSCVVSACESGTTNRFISTARLASQATGRRDRGIVGSPENGPFMPERGAKVKTPGATECRR